METITWYEATDYSKEPRAKEFIRETDKCLFYLDFRERESRERKETSYSKWHPTLEDAQADIARRQKIRAGRELDSSIRRAAPDLLEALECLYQCITEVETSGPDARAALEKARGAIAKARGDV